MEFIKFLLVLNELNLAQLIVYTIIVLFTQFVFSYYNEKGKNLATKEDVQELTKKVEEVKTIYAKELEEYKIRSNNFRTLSFKRVVTFYNYILKFDKEFANMFYKLSDNSNNTEFATEIYSQLILLSEKLEKYKLFFPPELTQAVMKYHEKIFDAVFTMRKSENAYQRFKLFGDERELEKYTKLNEEAYTKAQDDLKKIKNEIYEIIQKEIKY